MSKSVKDVAALANVSASTVSNYLNRPHLLGEGSRKRVAAAIAELGFVPNESARQLRAGSSKTLALILLDAWLPYFSDLSRGVEDVVRDRGWSLFFSNSNRDIEREMANLDMFEAHRVQGLVIIPQGLVKDRLEQLQGRGIECVVVGPTEKSDHISAVTFDDIGGGRLAGSHLVDIGRRRLAFLGNPHNVVQSADRLEGLMQAVAASENDTTVMTVTVTNLTIEDGIEAAEQILSMSESERPDAIFAANDMVAIGALNVFLRAGIRVPEDIAIVGYDDVPHARQAAVTLTTIRQPAYEMGRAAGQQLLEQIERPGSREVQQRVFGAQLVQRESTLGRFDACKESAPSV
ncbi:LacI family transcriptional regulator [Arthrobacter psychrolactophilus]|uniref:LacI family transcriptional regulator n=1 Tax=Arthrobacter psychrolactophilus TaxID=92442 RepID=A0A2V5ISB4_9MICC|nr:LacI family DNA-binding transcriptional regulator [Arthrobacter psychrolactophilus]PYI39448.1 LacI family transcriptional regulator [Arthrobacter psychrolactophilus]